MNWSFVYSVCVCQARSDNAQVGKNQSTCTHTTASEWVSDIDIHIHRERERARHTIIFALKETRTFLVGFSFFLLHNREGELERQWSQKYGLVFLCLCVCAQVLVCHMYYTPLTMTETQLPVQFVHCSYWILFTLPIVAAVCVSVSVFKLNVCVQNYEKL